MSQTARNLVVLVTRGTDHELSSVALPIANGGITAGLEVSLFLTSAGVDLVRKRAIDTTQVAPLEPLSNLMSSFIARGGTVWACTPCVKARGYEQSDFIDGVTITGASLMHELIAGGAATLSLRRGAAGRGLPPQEKSETPRPQGRGVSFSTSNRSD